ncbi:hypothetical protein Tco_0964741 [Tanacetum coccineum]
MLEGKVVLVGDDGLPFKLVNADTQAIRAGVGDVSGDPKAWDDENPKEAVVRDKNMPNEDEMIIAILNVEDDGEVLHTNGGTSSGTKKQAHMTRQEASTFKPFDGLNTIENDDDLGTDGGNSKLVGYGANNDNVSSSSKGPVNSNDISLVDLRNSFKSVDESESDVEDVYDETAQYMASRGANDASFLYEMVRPMVSTNAHSWLDSDTAIPGGVVSWALDPFRTGERVTLSQALVNQQVAPLVEVSGPFFVA